MHVLGYLFDPEHAGLRRATERIRDSHVGRAETMVRNIGRDYDFTWDDVLAQTSDGATVGRPHIADALVARGYAADRSAAFEDPASASRLLRLALRARPRHRGLAHRRGRGSGGHRAPRRSGADAAARAAARLIRLGLGGFRLGHRENTDEGARALRRLAEEHDLIVTGSSDYHGSGKPNRPGEHTTSDAMLARIIAAGTGSAPVLP